MRREFGGCAGNIAYNLNLLGEDFAILAVVGHDFEPYSQWLSQNKISSRLIQVLDSEYTGQAYITTDEESNQITAFHPGAMNFSHLNSIPVPKTKDERGEFTIGIVSPDGKEGMLLHAKQFTELEIPFIFDPGQGMPMFNGPELLKLIDEASWLTLNDYESELMQNRTGLSLDELAERVDALIITLGSKGSKIYTKGLCIDIPSAKPKEINDPTGCGDAYRAGLLYGLMNELDWETTGRIASLMGAIKIETHGTQNHNFDLSAFKHRFHENFGFSF
jgi:adenosine kinase